MHYLKPTEAGELLMGPRVNPRLMIHDITLREGEQAGDVNFSLDEKLTIAERLAEVGVRRIQGGFPGRSDDDARLIATLVERRLPVEIEACIQAFAGDFREQIDKAATAGSHVVSILFPCSDIRMRHMSGMTPEGAKARITEAIAYARDKGLHVRFSPTDTTRADISFLLALDEAALEAGARAISISDTVGCATPHSIGYIVATLVRRFGVPVHVHCHNDYGLAMANALAAVEAGAEVIDTTVNGFGERSGNVDMAQFVTTLQVLYGVDLGIDLTELTALSRLVSELARLPLGPTQPITGENSFSHKLDGHVQLVQKDPHLIEGLDPDIVGNQRRYPIGKHSGPFVVGQKLKQIGYEAEGAELGQIVQEVHRQAAVAHRSLEDSELRQIAQRMLGS